MVSSGCAKREVLNLTIGEYIKALSDYTNKKDIYEIIEDLGDAENVVPTFNIRRQKLISITLPTAVLKRSMR